MAAAQDIRQVATQTLRHATVIIVVGVLVTTLPQIGGLARLPLQTC